MPGLNQNGPMGQGAMTGRRMGKCTNFGAGKKRNVSNNPQEGQSSNISDESVQPQNRLRMGLGFGRRNATNNAADLSQGAGMGRGRGFRHRNRGNF